MAYVDADFRMRLICSTIPSPPPPPPSPLGLVSWRSWRAARIGFGSSTPWGWWKPPGFPLMPPGPGVRVALSHHSRDRGALHYASGRIESHSQAEPWALPPPLLPPDTPEHLCADIQAIDLRYLPRTRLLWASPICTEVSPAGGKKRRRAEMDLFEDYGHVPDAAFERTRVTFWEVLRAAEIHKQDAILIENVVEAFDWQLMPVFLDGLERLGYQWQVVSVSAAHVGDELNPFAPQWRDRIYIQALPKGVRMPKLEPRPKAMCFKCEQVVDAVQTWKPINSRRAKLWYSELPVGKYGQQYIYTCPVPTHGQVEPFVMPAAAAIDWSDLGTRIGDRKRPLSPATMRRIEAGARMIESGQFSFSMAHGGSTPFDVTGAPMRTWTTGDTEALGLSPEAAAMLVAACWADLRCRIRQGWELPTGVASGRLPAGDGDHDR